MVSEQVFANLFCRCLVERDFCCHSSRRFPNQVNHKSAINELNASKVTNGVKQCRFVFLFNKIVRVYNNGIPEKKNNIHTNTHTHTPADTK